MSEFKIVKTMIRCVELPVVILVIFISMTLPATAIKYAEECIIDAYGNENCQPSMVNEEIVPTKLVVPEENIFSKGGTLVFSADCKDDENTNCDNIISGKDSELCQPEFRVSEKCKLSCQLCSSKSSSIGVEQISGGSPDEIAGVKEVLAEMVRYLEEEVLVEAEYDNMYEDCINEHELCAFWAHFGECINNPNYMAENCILACKKCSEHPKYSSWS